MNKAWILVAVLIAGIGAFLFFKNQNLPKSPANLSETTKSISSFEFSNPKKSAHFESNSPEHASSLAGVPINIAVDFNFDLAKGSNIQITQNDKDYSTGETTIDSNKLAMRRNMDPSSPDGIYLVSYRACWADGSCHDGQFQFKIDRTLSEDFLDMRGRKEVTINLVNYAFSQPKVKISKGTKITWINQDDVIHTINTDPHPGHTYFVSQNSRDLKKGDSYSVTFTESGIYPYHCSPHASSMKAMILVE